MRELQGKVAFITAGVSGLGLGIAKALAQAGVRLALSYRNSAHRDAAAEWFAATEHEAPLMLQLDVRDRAAFAATAVQVERHFGNVHLLVNNAGVSVFGPTDAATYADYDWIMGVNFGGVVNGLVNFLPRMKAHGEGGHVVNVASMAAYLSGPQAGIYTASKFAVRGLTESLRYNLSPHGIGVSLMCPGLTRTNAWNSALGRPAEFADTGLGPVDPAQLQAFGGAFELGMDPDVVGRRRHSREPCGHLLASGIRRRLPRNLRGQRSGPAGGTRPGGKGASRTATARGEPCCGEWSAHRTRRPRLNLKA